MNTGFYVGVCAEVADKSADSAVERSRRFAQENCASNYLQLILPTYAGARPTHPPARS